MAESGTFVAVLFHSVQTFRDRAIEVPRLQSDAPPSRLRVPRTFAGAQELDLYELIGTQEWPERAIYRHVSIEPRT